MMANKGNQSKKTNRVSNPLNGIEVFYMQMRECSDLPGLYCVQETCSVCKRVAFVGTYMVFVRELLALIGPFRFMDVYL